MGARQGGERRMVGEQEQGLVQLRGCSLDTNMVPPPTPTFLPKHCTAYGMHMQTIS